jgi:hypothetical protein
MSIWFLSVDSEATGLTESWSRVPGQTLDLLFRSRFGTPTLDQLENFKSRIVISTCLRVICVDTHAVVRLSFSLLSLFAVYVYLCLCLCITLSLVLPLHYLNSGLSA